jgi:hypothetical protein
MRTKALAAIAVLAGTFAQAGEKGEFMGRAVTVCMDPGNTPELGFAESLVSKMFADIGLKIDWRSERTCRAAEDAVIHVSLDAGLRGENFGGILASTKPYEGTHINIFVERLRKSTDPKTFRYLLAHVLAHEITHILQVVSRHSEDGIMKARWSQEDQQKMAWKPLAFTERDVKLIYIGLDAWSSRAARVSR